MKLCLLLYSNVFFCGEKGKVANFIFSSFNILNFNSYSKCTRSSMPSFLSVSTTLDIFERKISG
jgi:hypothetical protein